MICSVIFDTFLPKKKSLSFPKNLEQSRSIEHREGCTKWGEVQKKKRRLILQTSYQGQRRPPFPCPREFNRGWNVLELGRDPPLPPAPPPPPPIDAVIANLGCGLQWRRTGRKGFRIPKGESRNLLSRVPPTRS